MAGELVEKQMEVAANIVMEMIGIGDVWKAETSEGMAKEIATVYRIIYDAIGETIVGQGGGPRKANVRTF
ncbi:MAG: hypothetical protein V3T71_04655 [Dehalococcoidia bacterium]